MPEIKYSYNDVPTMREFAHCDARIRGVCGPFRSGKSSASVVEIIRRAHAQAPGPDGIRRTRWLVIRNTFSQLEDSTIRTFHMWLPPGWFGKWNATDHNYTITAFEGVHIEVWFRALDRPDHVRNLLSVEVTGAWVNEAREIPWAIIEALDGRIGQYPPKMMGGPTWYGLWMDTNPPDIDSKWYRFFEETKHDPKRVRIFHQPSGLSPEAENLTNLPSPDYYKDLAYGKDQDYIDVYIHGKYGFIVDGRPVFTEYNDKIHCEDAKDLAPIPGKSIRRGWDFGLCYSDDTEVLTDQGWLLFKDVDPEVHKAASRNPKTGAFEWAPIAFKIAEPFKGELLSWQSTEVDMLVTPEHRVPFTYRDSPETVHWQSAQWLADHQGGHHYVDLLSVWEPEDRPAGNWFGMDDKAFAAFMGLYLSEGSVDLPRRVQIYQLKEKTKSEMRAILEATGLPWRENSTGWRLSHRILATWLAQFGTQDVRRVPREIREMPKECLGAFIAAYTLGDGHVRRRSNGAVEHTAFTLSVAMAGDLQEIAQKLSWNASARWRKPQTSIITEGATQRVITNTGGWAITFKKRASRAELLRRNFKRVPYDGLVYCLNVPHHTLYVRRNGCAHWNGNTPACTFSQLLPDGRWFVFDELVSDSMGIARFSDEVLAYCTQVFPHGAEFEDYGDPAGMQRAQTDERTCFEILQSKGILIEPGEQTVAIRLESIRKPMSTLIGGKPGFALHPRCKLLRKGFKGGYCYRRLKVSGADRFTVTPDKNAFSHPMDALQYDASRLFGGGLTRRQADPDDGEAYRARVTEDEGPTGLCGYG